LIRVTPIDHRPDNIYTYTNVCKLNVRSEDEKLRRKLTNEPAPDYKSYLTPVNGKRAGISTFTKFFPKKQGKNF
jgi:hypothetical protein